MRGGKALTMTPSDERGHALPTRPSSVQWAGWYAQRTTFTVNGGVGCMCPAPFAAARELVRGSTSPLTQRSLAAYAAWFVTPEGHADIDQAELCACATMQWSGGILECQDCHTVYGLGRRGSRSAPRTDAKASA